MKTHNVLGISLIVLAAVVLICGAAQAALYPRTDTYIVAAQTTVIEPIAVPREGLDVNHASADALEVLPGIGPVLAQAIVDEREARGMYFYPEDLLQVRGIGAARLKAIIDMVAIGE